jgi:hypothetical protein
MVYQLLIATLLFLIVSFGIGFILNLLTKTWWVSLAAYAVVAGIVGWRNLDVSFRIGEIILYYLIPALGAIAAGGSAYVLKRVGYSMFQ